MIVMVAICARKGGEDADVGTHMLLYGFMVEVAQMPFAIGRGGPHRRFLNRRDVGKLTVLLLVTMTEANHDL